MITKLGRDEVLKAPHMREHVSAISAQGWVQVGAKIGHGWPLLKKNSSSEPKATATNQMHSNDLKGCGKKCCFIFCFIPKSNFNGFLTSYWTKSFWLILMQYL